MASGVGMDSRQHDVESYVDAKRDRHGHAAEPCS